MDLQQISQSLNDFSFSVAIPSSGENVTGKFYTIRDEFKLAQIQTSGDTEHVLNGLYDFVKEKYYTMTPKQFDELTLADIQFLLIQLKIQSDEPVLHLNSTCLKCNGKIPFDLDLTNIKINNKEYRKTIKIESDKLTKPLGITLKRMAYIDMRQMLSDTPATPEMHLRNSAKMLYASVESITLGDEIQQNLTPEEIENFVNDIPRKYSKEFQDFVKNQPELIYDVPIICPNKECGHENSLDISDFFILFF